MQLYLGLILGIVLLLVKFVQELWHLISHVVSTPESEVIIGILALIDMALVGSLMLMVIFSGYEIFVSKIDVGDHQDRPEWMGKVDFRGSLADFFTSDVLDSTQRAVWDVWPDLAKGLAQLDLSNYMNQISQISGLGGGLTPAGDDFLLGIIMAIWCFLPMPRAQRLALEIVDATAGRTTTLSAAWLEAAGKGEASQYWHDFIDSLVIDAHFGIQRAARRIIGIGHTSGADALTGFLLGGEILSNKPRSGDGIAPYLYKKKS